MSKVYVVRGLPRSIALDGWWLTHEVSEHEQRENLPSSPDSLDAVLRRFSGRWGLLLLIVLGDFLLWGSKPALAFVIFVWCIFGVAACVQTSWQDMRKPAAIMLVSALPMLEHSQPLSIGFLIGGLLVALVWLCDVDQDRRDLWPASLLKLVMRLPFGGMKSLFFHLRKLQKTQSNGGLSPSGNTQIFLKNWAFPIGGTLMLSALLIGANPVIEQSAMRLFSLDLDVLNATQRLVFWFGLGLLLWPLLSVSPSSEPLDVVLPKWRLALGLNAGSVLRGLMLFNLFLAIQSVLDFSILLGGAELPEGMSYATYAHRGAYPLLATAMLAGAFALAARPFLSDHQAIKPLLLFWLIQNVLLCLSAALRLDLYVAEYGLTYLRIYALIWMGLVTVGLLLVAWQVLHAQSSRWLFLRSVGLGFGTLYVCAFVNFAGLIAAHTLDREADNQVSQRIDWSYLCRLGPTAKQTVRQKLNEYPTVKVPRFFQACFAPKYHQSNWREWDFRTWRTTDYLDAASHTEAGRWQFSYP